MTLRRAVAVSVSWLMFSTPLVSQSLPFQSTSSDEVPLQVIVVRSLEEAHQILQRLKKGEDFATLAKDQSIDPTANTGGYIGKLAPGMVRGELREALQGLAPGQVSMIAKIPEGYAILKRMSKAPADTSNPNPAGIQALTARGSVKEVLWVSGMNEAEEALRRYPKPEVWELSPRKTCEARHASLAGSIRHFEELLAPTNQVEVSSRRPSDEVLMHYFLADLYSYEGRMDWSLSEFEKAYQLAKTGFPAMLPQMEETLGIVYLHKSEMENDVYREPGGRCLFPIRPGNAYERKHDSEKAIGLLKYLGNSVHR